MANADTDEELNQLEKDIRQLKIEYEQYFGGGRKRPPVDTEWRIEQLIKRYADRSAEMSFGQRFRYSNLSQTYAKYREIFRKRLKQREEGVVQRHFGAAARAIEAIRAGRHSSPREAALVLAVRCSDPDREEKKVAELFQAFFRAKKDAGENTDRLTLDNFRAFLRKKTEHFEKREVEYVVAIERGQVRLKARLWEEPKAGAGKTKATQRAT